jgi:site-specific recombinase
MNIQTVADNLRVTISGKVKHQVELEYALTLATMAEGTALTATLAYLKINIGELKRILQDVEQCIGVEE